MESNVNDDVMREREKEMLDKAFEIRRRVLEMGTTVLLSHFGAEGQYAHVRSEILRYIAQAEDMVSNNEYESSESADAYLSQAETLYAENFPEIDQNLTTGSNVDTNIENANNQYGTSTYTRTKERVSNVVSYEVTVPVDEHDIQNYIIRGEKALNSGDLVKAKRLLLKAQEHMPTKNARALLRRVEEASRAQEMPDPAPEVTREERVNESVSPEETFTERDNYLQAAKEAMAKKQFEQAQTLLHNAVSLDPQLDVSFVLQTVEDAISRRDKIRSLITSAEAAVNEKNFAKAKKDLNELQTMDPNTDTRHLSRQLEKGLRTQREVKATVEKAKKCMREGKLEQADRFLREAKALDPDVNVSELEDTVQKAVKAQSAKRVKCSKWVCCSCAFNKH